MIDDVQLAPSAPHPVEGVRPAWRLTIMWVISGAALNVVWGAIPSVLIAVQLERFDPDAKVQNLAIITGLAALVSVIVQPVVGRLSDATRTRIGRRSPWMLGGAALGAVAIVTMGFATSVPLLIVLYLVVVIGINSAGLPYGTTLAERVAPRYRGVFSSLGAIGQFGGIVAGQAIAATLIDSTLTAYVIIAALALVSMLLFVVLNPEKPVTGAAPEKLSWRRMLSSFWFNPKQHPDFAWVILGRLLLGLGGYLVVSYNLYVLQSYIGMTTREAASLIPILSLVSGIGLIFSTLVAGPFSDRLGRRKIFLYFAGIVFAVGLLIPFFFPTVAGMIVCQALTGLALGCMGSVDQALMTEVLPDKNDVGKDLGIGYISLNIPQAFAPFLAGIIISIGGYAPLFPVAAVLTLLGGLSVVFIRTVR